MDKSQLPQKNGRRSCVRIVLHAHAHKHALVILVDQALNSLAREQHHWLLTNSLAAEREGPVDKEICMLRLQAGNCGGCTE